MNHESFPFKSIIMP